MAMPIYTRLSKYKKTHIKGKSNNGARPHLTAHLHRAIFMYFYGVHWHKKRDYPFDKDPKEL